MDDGVNRRAWLSLLGPFLLPSCRDRPAEPAEVEEEPWIPLMDSWERVMGGEVELTEEGSLRLGWGESLTGAKWVGAVPVLTAPFQSTLPRQLKAYPARAGADNVRIFSDWLGHDPAQLSRWRQEGVI